MNYAEQSAFVGRFRRAALGAVVAVAACFVVAAAGEVGRAPVRWIAVASLVAVAVLYGLWYLPLYLRLTVETRKRYSWSLRARYILVAVLAVIGVPATAVVRGGGLAGIADSARPWIVWAASVAIAAASVAVARRHLKRNREVPDLPLVPALLLAGDLAILALAAGLRPTTLLPIASGLALAGALYGLTSAGAWQWAGFAAVFLADALVASESRLALATPWGVALVLLPVASTLAAVLLTRIADGRHERNVAETVDDLAAFTLAPPDEASEMLATSTGILARNWNDSLPTGPDAVARWYEENSEYYLYDLAQFHLAYKHIAFMRDVVRLSRGRVLDFGAGIGDLALELARLGHETVYLDVDGRTKAFALWRAERDWIPLRFVSDLDEVDGTFETIISLDVFEHLAEPEPVIDALVERLAPGGRMIVTAAFGATKAHPMHFDHDLDLGAYLASRGLVDAKTFAMRRLSSEFLGKSNVLVFEKP